MVFRKRRRIRRKPRRKFKRNNWRLTRKMGKAGGQRYNLKRLIYYGDIGLNVGTVGIGAPANGMTPFPQEILNYISLPGIGNPRTVTFILPFNYYDLTPVGDVSTLFHSYKLNGIGYRFVSSQSYIVNTQPSPSVASLYAEYPEIHTAVDPTYTYPGVTSVFGRINNSERSTDEEQNLKIHKFSDGKGLVYTRYVPGRSMKCATQGLNIDDETGTPLVSTTVTRKLEYPGWMNIPGGTTPPVYADNVSHFGLMGYIHYKPNMSDDTQQPNIKVYAKVYFTLRDTG